MDAAELSQSGNIVVEKHHFGAIAFPFSLSGVHDQR
jgi:hypothetical protein